ncbi:MAG: serine/threonine protein kinase, partial [Planctomycetes bacterium]|nr:serine/threonine protein kinase [Planctomycetota bacterium]
MPQPLRISAYKILSVLGEGGMGVVYRAEQDNPRREVALKLLKAGGASVIALSRFKEEAQILGRLQHPGIAQIFEAGTADTGFGPQPFFAMEFVHGVPLQGYVDSNRLSLRSRLELMIKVCEGVHHAHQKGVIHRDLKPGNILVDESGQPKILDFGIALLADRDGSAAARSSEQRQLLGTVPYMSIEQFSGDPHEIDTRSDVYSLGVILYQLLAGRLPFDLRGKTIPQARHVVDEQEPTPLGVLNRTCRGDIESIVGKALEKERARRYQSASDLAADMRRFLNDEPVLACAPTRVYLFRKFAKRNKALLAGFLQTIAALSIGLIQARTERSRAVEAETLARKEATHAQAVVQLLIDAIDSVTPEKAAGEDVTIASVLDELAFRVESNELSENPEAEAKVLLTLGKLYRALAFPERAWTFLEAAATFYESAHGADDVDTLVVRAEEALVLENQGKSAEAEALCRQTLASARASLGDEHPVTIDIMQNLGSILQGQARFAEAGALYRQALDLAPAEPPGDILKILALQNDLARALKKQGDIKGAEELFRTTLGRLRREYSKSHPFALITAINLAETLVEQGQFDSAKTIFQETLIVYRQVFGYDHPRTFAVVNSLASLLRKQGKTSEAESLFTEVLDALHRKLGRDHLKTMPTLHNLASLLKENGE